MSNTTITETNRFHVHRFDILDISKRDKTTFETAAVTWMIETKQTDCNAELLEWFRHLLQLQKDNNMSRYFVKPVTTPVEVEEGQNGE